MNTTLTTTHILAGRHTVADTFTANLPAYLTEQLTRCPVTVTEVMPGVFIDTPDFDAIYPEPFIPDTGLDTGLDSDLDDAEWRYEWCNPYTAELLYRSATHAIANLSEIVDSSCAVFGDHLDVVDPDALDLDELEFILPTAIVEWLATLDPHTAATWLASFIAELDLHRAHIVTGMFPQPHSTGSEMALHVALTEMQLLFDDDDHIGDISERLRDLLVEDYDVLMFYGTRDEVDYAMATIELHPKNWFVPFTPDTNPWTAPL